METPTPTHPMQTLAHLTQSLSTNPLFSTIFTFYALTLLYFPSFFLRLFLSPVPIITALLLLTLLRLGSSPKNPNRIITRSESENCVNINENESPTNTESVSEKETLLEPDSKWVIAQVENGSSPEQNKEEFNRVIPRPEIQNAGGSDSGSEKEADLEDYFKWVIAEKEYYQLRDSENEDPNRVVVRPDYKYDVNAVESVQGNTGSRKDSVFGYDSIWVVPRRGFESGNEVGFVGWDVKAPLEVIYEEYEGEEDEDPVKDPDPEEKFESGSYPYLSVSFSDVESDSDLDLSSDGEFPVTGDWGSPERFCFGFEQDSNPIDGEGLIEIKLDLERANSGFHLEEENLIEIDIFSQPRKCEYVGEKMGVM